MNQFELITLQKDITTNGDVIEVRENVFEVMELIKSGQEAKP